MTCGVKFYADLPPEGYGVAAQRMMLGLERRGVPVTLVPEFGGKAHARARLASEPELRRLVERRCDYDLVVIHSSPDHWPRIAALEPGKVLIGATVWETDRPPASWREHARCVRRTIVPCTWNQRVLEEAGWPVPVDVVPHIAPEAGEAGAETCAPAGLRLAPDDFVFYSIGVWSRRKALAETVAAFARATRWTRRAVFVVKTSELDLATELRGRARVPVALAVKWILLRIAPWARVRVLTGARPARELAWLHARGDCYLGLSRGEGWGLGLFDACARGKPVIATAHGGPRDYLGDEAWQVPWRAVPVEPRNHERLVYTREMHWAEPDWRHATRCIREVLADPAAARQRARGAAERVGRSFGWRPATEQVWAVFERARSVAVAA